MGEYAKRPLAAPIKFGHCGAGQGVNMCGWGFGDATGCEIQPGDLVSEYNTLAARVAELEGEVERLRLKIFKIGDVLDETPNGAWAGNAHAAAALDKIDQIVDAEAGRDGR